MAPGPCSSCSGKCPGGVNLLTLQGPQARTSGTQNTAVRVTPGRWQETKDFGQTGLIHLNSVSHFPPLSPWLSSELFPHLLSVRSAFQQFHTQVARGLRELFHLFAAHKESNLLLFHLHSLFPPNTCWAVERRYPQLVVPVETHVTLLLCLPRCSQGPPCWEALGEWEKS